MLDSIDDAVGTRKRALVVGSGMAGCAAAWWLNNTGWDVVLVDKEVQPYPTSYLLQLDDAAVEVMREMGAASILEDVTFPAPVMSFRWGARKVCDVTVDTGGDWRISRRASVLTRVFDHIPDSVDTRRGLALEALEDHDHGVVARFGDGKSEAFDIVVGADGIHSTVRRLTLASAERSVYLNGATHVWINVAVPMPGKRAVIGSRENMLTLVYPFLDTNETSVLGVVPVDPSARPDKRELVEQVAGMVERLGPEMREVADGARRSDDVKLTRFSQVRTPRWHTRRVVLLGDAAQCVDPVSGMGSHASLVGAKTLALALRDHNDVTAAFAHYEAEMRPFARTAQSLTARAVELSTRSNGNRPAETVTGVVRDLVGVVPALARRSGVRARARRSR